MKTPEKETHRVVVWIPDEMYQILWPKAQRRGLIIPAYIRHVLLNDLEKEFQVLERKKEKKMALDGEISPDMLPF